jgi:hypothetical protein
VEAAPVTEDREGLISMLAGGARRATDGQLVVAVVVGLMGVLAILLWALDWWRWALPLVCVAAFGGWGISDRILRERGAEEATSAGRAVLVAARWMTAAIGGCALGAAGLAFMAQALGLMKS